MPRITINETVELTGKSKRTIQRHISAGKLSYTTKKNGTRMLDKGEVIATFGRPTTTVTHDVSHNNVTPSEQQVAELMQGLQQAIIESQAPLLAQIAELTDRVEALTKQLEHKPDPVVEDETVQEITYYSSDGTGRYDADEFLAFLQPSLNPEKASVVEFPSSTIDEPHYLEIPVFLKKDD